MKDLDNYMAAASVALGGAREAFGNQLANDTTAEAMCGYIEQRLQERGYSVSVRFEWRYPAAHRVLERLGFECVVGNARDLHFVITPRFVTDVAFVHVVKI